MTGCPYSPAEMLFNRCIRSGLPVTTNMLRPAMVSAHENVLERQLNQKVSYDRSARPLALLEPGSHAYVRTDEEDEWKPATVVDVHISPRSYVVDNGRTMVRRNRAHIKPGKPPTISLTINRGNNRQPHLRRLRKALIEATQKLMPCPAAFHLRLGPL